MCNHNCKFSSQQSSLYVDSLLSAVLPIVDGIVADPLLGGHVDGVEHGNGDQDVPEPRDPEDAGFKGAWAGVNVNAKLIRSIISDKTPQTFPESS